MATEKTDYLIQAAFKAAAFQQFIDFLEEEKDRKVFFTVAKALEKTDYSKEGVDDELDGLMRSGTFDPVENYAVLNSIFRARGAGEGLVQQVKSKQIPVMQVAFEAAVLDVSSDLMKNDCLDSIIRAAGVLKENGYSEDNLKLLMDKPFVFDDVRPYLEEIYKEAKETAERIGVQPDQPTLH